VLWPLFEKIRDRVSLDQVIVVGAPAGGVPPGALDYEQVLAGGDPAGVRWPALDERAAAAMCYTSGTTGRPKGVLYTHRSLVLHSMGAGLVDAMGLSERDTILPIVPMFHANAWGIPYGAVMVGAKLVMPGPFLDPASLIDLLASERVTVTAGVPTIWMGLLQLLDQEPHRYDLSALRAMVVGGSAVPRSMIEAYEKRHGLTVVQAWGMTETSPLGSVSTVSSAVAARGEDAQFAYRALAGRPSPFVQIRARNESGLVAWDGQAMGELEVRGPWVASAYFPGVASQGQAAPSGAPDEDRFTADGWFRTGDIVTITPEGYIAIQDRAKDLIKSGGEWISSVVLENAIMGHPAVAEAAVVAVPDEKWGERPLAAVVLKPGAAATADEVRDYLTDKVAKWWLPERVEFVPEIPKTTVGKFKKIELRRRFA
jgi:fatty-acyl-CoA synthase